MAKKSPCKIRKSFKPEPSCPVELWNSESEEEVLYSPKVFGTCALNCSYSLFIQDQSKIEKVHLYLNNASITFITAAVIRNDSSTNFKLKNSEILYSI